MKTTRIGLIAIALITLGAVPTLAQTGHDLFQQALVKEQADGDLRAAIDLYERIARDFATDAALAAKALLQMGQCYERLGSQEAQNAYRQLLERYPNEVESAEQARARLAALTQPPPVTGPSTIQARLLMTGDYGDDIEFSGGPSPDGRDLVYIDWESGNLAVRNLTSGQARMITDDGYDPGYPLQAQVSLNGKSVAYTWARNEDPIMELRVVGLTGSSPRTLKSAQGVYSPSWSRDGRHIAAVFHDGENSGTEVAWVSVEDGSRTALATYPQTLMPRLSHSPDDRFVAVAIPGQDDSDGSDIFLVATDGSGLRPLVDHPADDGLIGWVPGTDELLFSSDRSGDRDLWAVRVDPDGNAEDLRPVSRGIGELNPMGFTEDGSLFYFNYTLQRNHMIAPFEESTGKIAVERAEPIVGVGSTQRPSWSPDGEHLAFVKRSPVTFGGEEMVLHVRDVRTGEERIIAEHVQLAITGSPTWFPDGRSLLVLGRRRDGSGVPEGAQPAFYRIDLTTGEAAHLFDLPATPNLPSSWLSRVGLVASADGDGVIYHQDGGLVLHHLPSGQEEVLFRHPDLAAEVLALSPDGSELAFGIADPSAIPPEYPRQVRLNQGGRIMVIPTEGGEPREVLKLQHPCAATEVAWSSDGRHLFFLLRDEEGTAIMRVAREGGEVERMWETPEWPMSWTPSPDGRQVAFWIQENEAEIWIMENLVAALRRAAEGGELRRGESLQLQTHPPVTGRRKLSTPPDPGSG